MDIFLTWCYYGLATAVAHEKKAAPRSTKDRPASRAGLSEYLEFLTATQNMEMQLKPHSLLAVNVLVPSRGEAMTFKLAQRLPGTNTVPIAVAVATYLSQLCPNEWSNQLSRPFRSRVTFVGLCGVHAFLQQLAFATAAHGVALPISMWRDSPYWELPSDSDLRRFWEDCRDTAIDGDDRASLASTVDRTLADWRGTGVSAEADSRILLMSCARLGWRNSEIDRKVAATGSRVTQATQEENK